jgi:hypothetical protein
LTTPPAHSTTAESMLGAAEAAYDQLRARLVVSLGELGFEALWARAIHLAVRQIAPPAPVPSAPYPPALRALVSRCDRDQTAALLLDVFASFFHVLATFIGEPLMFRIIDQLWPAFRASTADRMHQKESDHDDV